MKKFTRILSLVMVIVMVMSMAACNTKTPGKPDETKPALTEPAVTDPVESEPIAESWVTFFSLSIGENYDDVRSMTAYLNEDGTAYVEYVGAEKKIGNIGAYVMNGIAAEMAKTELANLNGKDNYGDGEANGYMHIEFADGTAMSVNYTGEIPEAFTNSYNTMDAYFQAITADMETYVPQPMIMDVVNDALLTEMMAVLNGSGMSNLDTIAINGINVDDEFFADHAGLTSSDGIAHAANAVPMMMSQAYSLVIVSLDEGADAEVIGKDFEKNIDWQKWVCVAPSNVLIAVKDNMVLCLQAADDAYTMTVAGIDASGWTHVNELSNPNM